MCRCLTVGPSFILTGDSGICEDHRMWLRKDNNIPPLVVCRPFLDFIFYLHIFWFVCVFNSGCIYMYMYNVLCSDRLSFCVRKSVHGNCALAVCVVLIAQIDSVVFLWQLQICGLLVYSKPKSEQMENSEMKLLPHE